MKFFLSTVICSLVLSILGSAAPKLTPKQVTAIGKLVLTEHKHTSYKDRFKLDEPEYDAKQKVWRFAFTGRMGNFPGASPPPLFEVRDADGSYRLWHAMDTGRKVSEFGISPRLRRKIREILKE